MPGTVVDGMDVLAVKEATEEAIKKIRSGSGPAFIEATTFRYQGHSMADPAKYRTDKELDEWKEKDPLINFRKHLLGQAIVTESDIDKVSKSADNELNEAVKFATESPEPDLDDIKNDIYA